jgi:hypothetical protein
MFLAAQKHHTKHHNKHAFHHKLTTFLPSKNTIKSQTPRKNHIFPRQIFFSKTNTGPHLPTIKADRRDGEKPHAASEVVLPCHAPQT